MHTSNIRLLACCAALLLPLAVSGANAPPAAVGPDDPDEAATAAAMGVMGHDLEHGGEATSGHAGHHHDANDPHMHLSALRAATPADQARYAALLSTIRSDLAKYQDVARARADGFEQFLPDVPQPVYHFTRKLWAIEAAFGFDPRKPTSLLYRQEPAGAFTLVGVMYTAPARLGEADLDARIPLGIVQWHQHVNWCVPGPLHRERWRETRNGLPVFGPQSPIATGEACEAVDGYFLPRIFGWMVHIEAFDPAAG